MLKKYRMTKNGVFIYIFTSFLISESLQTVPEESRLLRNVLKDHSNDIRPLPKQQNGPTVVNIELKIIQPLEIDERNEILSLLTWTSMRWEDSTFTWDPGAHKNINRLLFPAGSIWIPDIMLHNTQDIATGFHLGLPQKEEDLPFMAAATANGSMMLSFPHIFKSNCKLNISEYPFDTQYCPLIFGSWSHDDSEVVINIDFVRSDNYVIANKAWQLIESKCRKKQTRCAFHDADEKCQIVECHVGLKRTAWFEVISYTLPTIIIAALSIMVFMVPPEAGKRMEVGITLILCVAVYLSLINKKMPPTSESFPLVSKFYGCIIVEITIAMVCSCYCLHIYDPEGLRLLHFPNYLRTLAFGVLARLTFYQTKGGKPSRVHPTNAELKIVEKRRKSMIAVNGSIQLSQNPSLARKRGVQSNENGQFRMQMEEIKECPESPEIPKEETKEEDSSNNNNTQNEEQIQEMAADLPIEDIEEQNIEADQALNDNQIIGENRCDSGFGEPGGSLSNRSLLSSDSVRLPADVRSSPTPQCDANCECGQPNCNGQGVIDNSAANQDASADDAANGTEDDCSNISGAGKEKLVQFDEMVKNQADNKERGHLKRAQTVFAGEFKTSGNNGGPLSKTLSARPYTDSVLATWTRRKNVKQFQLRAKASLRLDGEDLEKTGAKEKKRRSSTTLAQSKSLDLHLKDSEARQIEVAEDKNTQSDQQEKQESMRKSSNASSRRASVNSSKGKDEANKTANKTVETNINQSTTNEQSEQLNPSKNDAVEQSGVEIRAEASIDASGSSGSVNNSVIKTRRSYDEIELVDINEEESLESTAELITETTTVSRETLDTEISDDREKSTSSTIKEMPALNRWESKQLKSNNNEGTGTSTDTETEVEIGNGEKNDVVKKRSIAGRGDKQSNILDPKVLFARRHWDTLRNRMQRRITVKEVFGQILSPKETSPIVAIANVLLRDQRKYVMRTEWMTSAIIFNRFFIIVLALAVFISLLAVFMQSSRLRAAFDL